MFSSGGIDSKELYFSTTTFLSDRIPAAVGLHSAIQVWHHAGARLTSNEPSISVSLGCIVACLTGWIFIASLLQRTSSNQIAAKCLIKGLPRVLRWPTCLCWGALIGEHRVWKVLWVRSAGRCKAYVLLYVSLKHASIKVDSLIPPFDLPAKEFLDFFAIFFVVHCHDVLNAQILHEFLPIGLQVGESLCDIGAVSESLLE